MNLYFSGTVLSVFTVLKILIFRNYEGESYLLENGI